jgi:hypothetical protein
MKLRLILTLLGFFLQFIAQVFGIMFLFLGGFRKRMPHERRPYHIGFQKNWTNEPM